MLSTSFLCFLQYSLRSDRSVLCVRLSVRDVVLAIMIQLIEQAADIIVLLEKK